MRSRAKAWRWPTFFAASTSSAAAAVALSFSLLAASAAGQTPYDCYGSVGSGPEPEGGPPLVFGLYPLEGAGQIGVPAEPVTVDRVKRAERLRELQPPGKHPLVMHLYTHWRGQQTTLDEQTQLAPLRELTALGYQAEVVVRYMPDDGGTPDDPDAYAQFVRSLVRLLGPDKRVKAIQVTNEANQVGAPDAADGAFAHRFEALVKGVVAADDEARRGGFDLDVGFNWFYRQPPNVEEEMWGYLRDNAGPEFHAALDWVGLDAYPGTFFPPSTGPEGQSGDARGFMRNAMSLLRECLMKEAKIAESVPIHVTENGWPTGPGRSEEQQVSMLQQMLGAVWDYRGNYNVTDYRFFTLRDGDTSSPNFQQHYGLLRDDYSPKPAFAAYRSLIEERGAPAPAPAGATAAERAAGPRLRLRVLHRRRGILQGSVAGDVAAVRSVVFGTHACRARTDSRAPFRRLMGRCHSRAYRGHRGRRHVMRAAVTLLDGRRVRLRRAYRGR